LPCFHLPTQAASCSQVVGREGEGGRVREGGGGWWEQTATFHQNSRNFMNVFAIV